MDFFLLVCFFLPIFAADYFRNDMHLQFKFFLTQQCFLFLIFITYGFKNRRTLRFFHCVVVFSYFSYLERLQYLIEENCCMYFCDDMQKFCFFASILSHAIDIVKLLYNWKKKDFRMLDTFIFFLLHVLLICPQKTVRDKSKHVQTCPNKLANPL